MRTTYWFLSLFSFFILLITLLIILPLTSLILGLFFGFLGIILNMGTLVGDMFVKVSIYIWKFWWISLITSIILTISFIKFTDNARKTSIYRKIKIK